MLNKMEFEESEKEIFMEKLKNEINLIEEEFETAVNNARLCDNKFQDNIKCNACKCFAHDPYIAQIQIFLLVAHAFLNLNNSLAKKIVNFVKLKNQEITIVY